MRVTVSGPFRVFDAEGVDRTPAGMKERALLALLALSPGQRRTRAWLRDKLWSDRDPELANGSLRQALNNIRKSLGPLDDRFQADRGAIWLHPLAQIDRTSGGTSAELLSDIDVPDPEFEDWLRDLRMAEAGPAETGMASPRPLANSRRPVIRIRNVAVTDTGRAGFLGRLLSQRIQGELVLIADVDVFMVDGPADNLPEIDHGAEIDCVVLEEGNDFHLLLRVIARPGGRCIWSGRSRQPASFRDIWDSAEVTRLVNQAVGALSDQFVTTGRLTPFAAIQRSIRRIYEFNERGLNSADEMLVQAQDSELSPLALSWRAFVRLTAALEFRDFNSTLIEEAEAFCAEALGQARSNPVVLGLLSQVQLKLVGDLEFGHYLALRAAEASDQNPYALDALGLAEVMRGNYDAAYRHSTGARKAAEGLSNSFSWDMQCALSSLGVGRIDEALDLALVCHRKMPLYRPPLRYLTALNLLLGHREEASDYARRLSRLESGFEPRMLLSPDYPVETLRVLGLVNDLRPMLT